MKFPKAEHDALLILPNDAGRARNGDESSDRNQNQKKCEKSSSAIHDGSPHSESYAFDGQNLDFGAGFESGAVLLRELRAPFFRTDFNDAAIARRDALGDDTRAANDRVHVGRLRLHVQFGAKPFAEQCKIKKRENASRKQTDICGAKDETDDSARYQRRADERKIESSHHAERKLRDDTKHPENDQQPIDRIAHGGDSFADVPRTITLPQTGFNDSDGRGRRSAFTARTRFLRTRFLFCGFFWMLRGGGQLAVLFGGPARFGGLPAAPKAESIRRNVFRNRRSGGDISAVADSDGRNEDGIAADKDAIADRRLVLVHTVVVARNRSRANVGVR